jgi:folate-binding protein YgfZ
MTETLENALRSRGATLETFRGNLLPARFDSPETEWRYAREGCAVFAAGFRAMVRASGSDRESFLHGMLSNDVKALQAGQGAYAAHLTQQGKIVCDLRLYRSEDFFLLDTLASRSDALLQSLDRYLIADDVEFRCCEEDTPLLGLEGSQAVALLARVLGQEISGPDLSHRDIEFRGSHIRVVVVSEVNRSGLLLCGTPALAADLFAKLCECGAKPIGMEALDVLRVEGGVPWYGLDMDDEVLLMETGLERAVSFTKGCYLGQEVVERIVARGRVNRKLSGLLFEGADTPEPGVKLTSGEREVGYVTSSVRSFALNRPIGLGYVHRSFLEPGTELEVGRQEGRTKATVTKLPFVL